MPSANNFKSITIKVFVTLFLLFIVTALSVILYNTTRGQKCERSTDSTHSPLTAEMTTSYPHCIFL